MKEEAKNILEDCSMNSILTVLFDFPCTVSTPYMDVLLSVEPMSVFHLAFSRISNEAAMDRLRCTTKTTDN